MTSAPSSQPPAPGGNWTLKVPTARCRYGGPAGGLKAPWPKCRGHIKLLAYPVMMSVYLNRGSGRLQFYSSGLSSGGKTVCFIVSVILSPSDESAPGRHGLRYKQGFLEGPNPVWSLTLAGLSRGGGAGMEVLLKAEDRDCLFNIPFGMDF